MKELQERLIKVESNQANILKILEVIVDKLNKIYPDKCGFYMPGMDTSGRCNNCGRSQYEHIN